MNGSNLGNPPSLPSQSGTGLAIACLVFGVLAFLSGLIVIGGLFAVAGIITGVMHLRRSDEMRGLATAGIILSGIGGLLAAAVVGVIALGVLASMPMSMGNDFSTWEGKPAPDFQVTTLDGTPIQLSALRGKRVIVDVWATWCPPCRMEIPHFNDLASELGPDQLVILGVSSEDAETIRDFMSSTPVNYLVATDPGLPSPFGDVTALPTTFFIDRNGIIDAVLIGYHDMSTLRAHVTASDYGA